MNVTNRFWLATGWASSASMIIILDRATKWYAMERFVQLPYTVNSILFFCCELNYGISWNLLSTQSPLMLLAIITVITCCITVWFCTQWQRITPLSVGLCLIASGSVSNIVDRIMYGGVVDWIAVHLFGYEFPIFNIADCAIVCGTLLVGHWMYAQ